MCASGSENFTYIRPYQANETLEWRCRPCGVGWHSQTGGNCECVGGYYIHRSIHHDHAAGETRWEDDCIPCPFGTYSEVAGFRVSSCTQCPAGHTTSQAASTHRSQCGKFYFFKNKVGQAGLFQKEGFYTQRQLF